MEVLDKSMEEVDFDNADDDYVIVYALITTIAENPDVFFSFATILERLTGLEFDKVSHFVEYLYRSMTKEELMETVMDIHAVNERIKEVCNECRGAD
jgi:DNA-binding response OmpR family regulator